MRTLANLAIYHLFIKNLKYLKLVKVPNLKLKLLVLQVLLFLWKFDAKAQYLQSFNYNINDGLISNKVYNIMEDRNGFIWICTDQGVSRFDGINFQNFTTKEGLPNNEILNVFEDSKGRIWFNSFGTEPCYYENSKIYNSDNDSLLRRIKYNKPQGLCLTSIVQWNNSLAFLIKQGEHKCFVGKDIQDIRIIDSNLIRSYQFQNILIQTGNTYHLVSPIDVFSWENGKTLRKTNIEHWGNSFFYYSVSPFSIIEGVRNLNNRIELYSLDLKLNNKILGKINEDFSRLMIFSHCKVLTGDSTFRVYKHGLDKEFETFKTPFLFDQLCIDRKNNKWFGTFENGIYLIKSNAPKEIDLNNKIKKGILSLKTDGERLLLLTEKNGLIAKDKSNVKQLFYLEKFKRIRGFVSGKNFKLIGIDGGLYKTDNNFKRLIHLNTDAVKDIEHGFGDDILIGSSSKAHLFRNDTLVRLNDKRTTAICAVSNHEIWMGGLNGIETIQLNAHNAKAKPINIHPIINESHINDIKRDKFGNIWIATNQDGLFQYNNGKVFQFNTSSSSDRSITSDICIEIYPKENGEIWLITNKGISILRSEKSLNLVWKSYNLTSAEGFPIQGISGLAFISNSLFVSTQSGLFEFNKLPIVSNETSATIITKLEVNFNTANMHQLILPYDSNNLTISFASSFINTNSEYAFKFRVKQLGQDWIKTNFLQVPLYNLSPGKYTFEIASLNAHGRAGPVSSIEFTIKKPWYNTWWFVSSISLLIVSIAVYYIKLNRDRLKLNNDLIRQKLRVLRSQMNPHFVFNALSNLQNLVHSKNTVVTNEYIGKLAHIIRKGIEFTDSEFITLDKEIEYTRHYLDIEKTRFGEKFNWELICKIDPNKLQELKVPPLLIQPMAENAIKHAFKSIKTNGFLSISIELSDKQTISYTIKDNGIGISEASMNSTRYGLGIVKERIQLLYKNNSEKGQFSIENINDENTSGTKITILLPKIKNQT